MVSGLEQLSPDIARALGIDTARQAARAASQRQPAPYVDEEEERSLIRSLRDNSLTTVGAIGNFLDLPGSAVRDVGSMIATGKWVNPVDQFIFSPFSSENRTTGKDLLQQTGLAGGKESWGKSIAGFGLEMAMDPLTYMTLGASAYGKAGQAAAKFGLADEAVRVATKKAGAAPGSIGAREARLTTTAQDIAANSTGITKKRADDFLKTLTPEEAAQPLGGMIGIGLPFMQPKAVFGTGPKSIAAAKGLDAAGRAIRFGKIPGTNVQNPVGALMGLFDAPAKGAKTAEGAFAARELFRNAPRNEATMRGNAANMATAIADVTKNLDSDAAKEVDTYLRSRPWYVEPKNLDERHSLISDAILEAGELASENPDLIDKMPKSIQWIADQMKYENSLLPGKTRRAGGAVTELNDNIDYMARYASIGGKIKSSIGEDASTFDPSFAYRRLDFLRDIPGGTVAFKRGIVMDKVLRDMIKDKKGIDAVADYLRTTHSKWLPDTYTSFYQSGKNKGKAYTKTGRYDAMAKMLYGQDADVLERGLFGNSVVFDHLNRQLGSIRQTSTLDNIADLLSSKTPEGAARYIKTDADWKAAGADIGSPDDTTMSMQKFLKTMGLPAYAIHNVLKTGKPKKGGFLRALGKKMGIDHKELRHARIDKRIADDLIRIHKAATTRGPGEEILEMTDSVTNLTKGMLTSDWPSFHVRNIMSGWAQNAMLGMWDKQSAGWAGQIMVGNAMKGSSKVEWTGREYARRARSAGWDDVAIADKLKKTGYSQAQINQFLSQAGKARKTTPPGPPGASGPTPPGPQGPGPIPPQSPPGQVGPRGPSPQGPIPPGQVSPATAPPASAVDPLVADADALLAKIDAGGAMPAMITGSLRRIAKAVGVDVTNKMKPADVVEAIRQARKSAPPGTQAVSADMARAGSIDIGGVARSTVDSTGAPIHTTEEGVKNFWEGFKDSKVVDAEGKPLVVYHGATQSFDSFNDNSFLTSSPDVAGEFATRRAMHAGEEGPAPRTIPVYVSIEKPFVIDAEGKFAGDVQFARSDSFGYRKALESGDYDGVIIKNTKDEGTLFIPRKGTQIKSATGNRGTFDQFDTDIRNLPNPKAGSLFESASETPVDRTGFTPAQVGFESANMPRPAAGDPWNKKSFSERSAEHAKFGKVLDSLVRSKSIQQKHADLLRVAFFGASEEGMKIMNMPKFGGRAKIGPSDPAGRWTAKVNRVTGEIIEPQILIRKNQPEGQDAFNTMLHELFHMGHAVLKRDLGKAWSDNFDETLKRYRESGDLLRYFESVHGKEIGRYLASTPNENFAQLMADSITRRKVPDGAIGKIISDIRDWIVTFLERIKLTTPLPTELNTFIDEIADSMLGYDGKKLSDLMQPKAVPAPSQVSPVPSVTPVPQVPGVQPVSPITSTPTPVPVGAVAPTPGSVGPPTGPPAPPVVPPGPPGPPMGPAPRPPRKPVRGVDSTFPDPKTGTLPDLDDTLATTMLGQRAYADGVIGSIDADRAGDLAGNFEVKSGTVREMLGGIPRPGYKSFSAYRTVAKALGFEPGTTYNPLHRRGVGGRTATNFSIGAAGEEVGHLGEGLVRLQPWFALIKKGYDPSVAAEKVAAAQVSYSNRNFTDFELKYMRRLLPFYKFSRQQIPFQMKQLMEKPGGTQAQLIRGLNQAQSQGELAPDYVRDTASIPVSDQNPILKSIIGAAPDGTDRYLSGLGLMAEDLYSVGPGVRGTGQEFLSRLNPMIKGPLEYFTNQSFFQAGPEGGRPLDEMDPLIGRTIANLTGQKDAVKLPQILEVAAANSPISRFLTTARTLTDPRKRSTVSPIPLPGAAAAINLLTGARVTDVSPGSKDAIVRDLLTSRMKGAGARAFERVNFTKEDLAKMSPQERETALQLQGLANVLARRSKERAAERKKAEGN